MSNLSLISPWHSPEEDEAFLILLKRGDLIEFDRGSYSHWAVYLGTLVRIEIRRRKIPNICIASGMVPVDEVAVEDDDDGLLFSSQAMVVHRANPGVQENGWASWTSAISKVLIKKKTTSFAYFVNCARVSQFLIVVINYLDLCFQSSSGGGEVCFEKLSDVWGKANAR